MKDRRVLVFPRVIFDNVFSLLPWDSIQVQLEDIESSFSWLSRVDAERSVDLVQAIPCAFIRNDSGKCCVLRRVQNARTDLNKKLSLVVGGHMDDVQDHESFIRSMYVNLCRELEEEIGLLPNVRPRPVGVIVDSSTVGSSRHVAFVHELVAEDVSPRAPEEFTVRSRLTGEFMAVSKLAQRRDEFDPWSRLLIEDYVCSNDIRPEPRQRSFL